jgi:hypothetical protein
MPLTFAAARAGFPPILLEGSTVFLDESRRHPIKQGFYLASVLERAANDRHQR